MDREHLVNLLEAVRGVRAAVFQMEQELLNALTAEQQRREASERQPGDKPDDWFTLAELGAWLKISRTTAYKLIREKSIPAYRIGRATRIRRRDVERWLEAKGRDT